MVKKTITNQRGFSVVEVLLASTIFALLITAVIGAVIYGRVSTATAGNRSRANLIAEEGLEAVRSIRDASYANLVDGTYGLSQAGNVWSLAGSSDTTGLYTRRITISSASGTDRKTVKSDITWQQGGNTGSTSVETLLTNWQSTIRQASWTTPAVAGGANASGSSDGIKVATSGNYAYMVQNSGTNNFVVINVSDPANPTVLSKLTLPGVTTNIAVNGDYAYVTTTSNTAELVIINISNPSSPVQVGTYNAAGNADALGVYVIGNYAYISRAANGNSDEVVIIDVSTPILPIRLAGFATNITMNEIYVDSATGVIYVATSSGTQELIKYTPILLGLTYSRTNVNLPGTVAATTISGSGSTIYVGQGTSLYAINGSSNTILSSLTLPDIINDISLHTSQNYVFVGTDYINGELQVVNNSNLSALSIAGSADLPGSTHSLKGVAYNSSLDIVVGARAANTQEAVIFTKN